jgi:hypothetical protein
MDDGWQPGLLFQTAAKGTPGPSEEEKLQVSLLQWLLMERDASPNRFCPGKDAPLRIAGGPLKPWFWDLHQVVRPKSR